MMSALEVRLTLEIPDSLTLLDGTTAEVKAVAARMIDGRLAQIVYTVERKSGAWMDVGAEEVAPASAGAPTVAA
jgi:hypothetical protein